MLLKSGSSTQGITTTTPPWVLTVTIHFGGVASSESDTKCFSKWTGLTTLLSHPKISEQYGRKLQFRPLNVKIDTR